MDEPQQHGIWWDLRLNALYNKLEMIINKLEMIILPMFCNEPGRYAEVMRHSIALNASFFNTERMLSQYITKAYFK